MSLRKLFLVVALQTLSLGALAEEATPSFSAFAKGDALYVTILADTCNSMFGSLNVHALCRSDRMTRNYAIECDAQLLVRSTKMACPGRELKPRILTLSLSDNKVAPEARVLHLEYDGKTIDVPLK